MKSYRGKVENFPDLKVVKVIGDYALVDFDYKLRLYNRKTSKFNDLEFVDFDIKDNGDLFLYDDNKKVSIFSSKSGKFIENNLGRIVSYGERRVSIFQKGDSFILYDNGKINEIEGFHSVKDRPLLVKVNGKWGIYKPGEGMILDKLYNSYKQNSDFTIFNDGIKDIVFSNKDFSQIGSFLKTGIDEDFFCIYSYPGNITVFKRSNNGEYSKYFTTKGKHISKARLALRGRDGLTYYKNIFFVLNEFGKYEFILENNGNLVHSVKGYDSFEQKYNHFILHNNDKVVAIFFKYNSFPFKFE